MKRLNNFKFSSFWNLSMWLYTIVLLFMGLTGCTTPEKCNKADFLFVIDNSGSMEAHQANLIKNIPRFMGDIASEIEDLDYHVGVVSTDDFLGNPKDCQKIGSLISHSVVQQKEGEEPVACFPKDSKRSYISSNDQNVKETFDCIARLGTSGNNKEQPLKAIEQLVQNQDSSCNQGFLREDAILVVTTITDEGDYSDVDVESLQMQLQNLKNDMPNAIVLLSLLSNLEQQNNGTVFQYISELTGFSDANTKMVQFTNGFVNGFFGDITSEDYRPIFDEALMLVTKACFSKAETCPMNECCYPTNPLLTFMTFVFPLVIGFVIQKMSLPRIFEKGVDKGLNIDYAEYLSRMYGLLFVLMVMPPFIYATSKTSCFPEYSWIPIVVVVTLMLILFFTKPKKNVI